MLRFGFGFGFGFGFVGEGGIKRDGGVAGDDFAKFDADNSLGKFPGRFDASHQLHLVALRHFRAGQNFTGAARVRRWIAEIEKSTS